MEDEQIQNELRRASVQQFIEEEALPDSFGASFIQWYAGITEHLAAMASDLKTAPLVGVSGCQGSGKSTLVKLMAHVLRAVYGVNAVVLSLDDFYLTRSARREMADTVHPLFATRGVPGTHDLTLLRDTINALRASQGEVAVPGFDKAADDRTEMVHWRQESAPVGLIFLEGWCVGVPPQPLEDLISPVNETEAEQDADSRWRTEVNRQLGDGYAALFADLDELLVLQAPSFDAVYEWRWQQEQRLSALFKARHPDTPDPTMTRQQVADFILHYQRITEHALVTLPDRADVLWELGDDRSVQRMHLTGVAA